MLKSRIFMKGGLFFAVSLISTVSQASDRFPGSAEPFNNKPDFLKERDRHDSDLAPFDYNKTPEASPSAEPTTQPPAPPPIPPRRIQQQ